MSSTNPFGNGSNGSLTQIANAIQAQSLQNQFTQAVFNGWLAGIDSLKQTPAEIAAGVTPVNYAYAPTHIGDDVRRYGNIDLTGATDCRAILNTANSVGVALYFPPGTYKVSSNLTLSVACIFDQNAILKPDTSVVITITGPIVAGPWQIFNVSNTPATGSLTAQTSLQTGVTPIAGPCPIEKCYAEWFGAVGNGSTDDSGPIQGACNFALSSYGIPVQLQAKIYKVTQTIYTGGSAYQLGTGSGGQSGTACSLYGVSAINAGVARLSKITDAGTFSVAGTPLVRYRNINSEDQHAEVRDISFDSVATTTKAVGIEWAGSSYCRAVNCHFAETGLYEAVRWNNTLENNNSTYTEFCILEKCEIFTACVNAVGHYVSSVSNDSSFHGSGLSSRTNIGGPNGAAVIIIDAGAQPYNSPFDAALFSGSSNMTLFHNLNSSQTNISFCGDITLEIGSLVYTLADTNTVYFTGSIRANGTGVIAGTLLRCRAIVNNGVTAVATLDATRTSIQTMAVGTNKILTHAVMAGLNRKVMLQLSGSNYLYVYEITLISQLAFSTATTVVGATGAAPAPSIAVNTAGYGAPTFSGNTDGTFNVINANAGFNSVTAVTFEQQMSGGEFGGLQVAL